MQLAMHHRTFLFVFAIVILGVISIPRIVHAETTVSINEFSVDGSIQTAFISADPSASISTTHWVELYNAGDTDIPAGLKIHNGSAAPVVTFAPVPAHGISQINVLALNFSSVSGTILLTDGADMPLDSVEYGPTGLVPAPSIGMSAYRFPDGGPAWKLGISTAGGINAPVVNDDSYALNRESSLVIGNLHTSVSEGLEENDHLSTYINISNCSNTPGSCSNPVHAFSANYPYFVVTSNGVLRYTPRDGYSGIDYFHYGTINNLIELLEPSRGSATVTLHVSPIPLIDGITGEHGAFELATSTAHPVFSGQAVQMASTSIASIAIDISGDTHNSRGVIPDSNGRWSLAAAQAMVNGVYSVKVTATDLSGNTESQQFNLNISRPTEFAVDDDWATSHDGDVVTLGGTEYKIGTDAFVTVSAAVQKSTNFGVIHIAPGTYHETPTISLPLTLAGAQSGIAGKNHTGSESALDGLAIVSSDVTLDGVTLKGDGTLLTVRGGGTLDRILIENNIFTGDTLGYSTAIDADNTNGITLRNNLFKKAGANANAISLTSSCSGAMINGNTFQHAATGAGHAVVRALCVNSTNVTVSGNTSTGTADGASFTSIQGVTDGITIAGNTVTGTSGAGVLFKGGVTGTAVVSGNTITGGDASAVSLQGSAGANSGAFTVSGNDLSHNASGVKIGGDSVTDIVSGASVIVHNNTFSSGETGVDNNSTSHVSVKADQNWWGSSAGPGSGNTTGDGASDVTDAPWNADADGTALVAPPVASTTASAASITFGDTVIAAVKNTLGTTTVHILDKSIATGPADWNGVFLSPVKTTTDALAPSTGTHASGVEAVAFGSKTIPLTFNRAVKITFAGQAGKHVGWALGDTFEPITNLCSGNSQAEVDAYFASHSALTDCTYASGENLIVWTVRAGTFVVYAEISDDAPPGGGGGDGGGSGDSSGSAPSINGLTSYTVPAKTATWVWTSEPGATFRFSIDTNPGGAPTGTYKVAATATRTEGTGTFYVHVQAKSADGNVSAVRTASAVLDNTPPAPPSINVISPDMGVSSSDRLTNATALTVYGTTDAGNVVTLRTGSNTLGTATADNNGNWNVSSVYDSGSHTVKALATDAVGNVSELSAGFTFVIDTTAPHVTLVGSNPLHLQFGHLYEEPGASASDVEDGSETVAITGSVNTAIVDSYTLTYTASDDAGNSGIETRTIIVEDKHVPTALNASATGTGGVALPVTLQGSDSDGDTIHFVVTSQPNSGTVSISGSTATYTPNSGFVGKDSFTYVASDGVENSIEKTVSLTILEPLGGVTVSSGNTSTNTSSNTGGVTSVSSNTNTNSVTNTIDTSEVMVSENDTTTNDSVSSVGTGNSPAVASNGEVLGVFTYHFDRELGVGTRGDDVVALQQYLTDIGFYTGPITGYFGPLTEAGVKAFQSANGIPNTGYVGPRTLALLNSNTTPVIQETQTTLDIQRQLIAALTQLKSLLEQLLALRESAAA